MEKNEELARRHWTSAFAGIGDAGLDGDAVRLLSAGISNDVDRQALLDIHILPAQKRVLLMAFGLACPEHRDELFAQARWLNVSIGFPQRFVHRIVSGEVEPGDEDNPLGARARH